MMNLLISHFMNHREYHSYVKLKIDHIDDHLESSFFAEVVRMYRDEFPDKKLFKFNELVTLGMRISEVAEKELNIFPFDNLEINVYPHVFAFESQDKIDAFYSEIGSIFLRIYDKMKELKM